MNKSLITVISGAALLLTSCHNSEQLFPDFDYQTISFANQTPLQCITLGEDGEYDVTMDNEHRFQVMAVLGGINTNKENRWVDYKIDNSLVEGLTFADTGKPVKALPASYYTVTSDPSRIYINKGSVIGGIDIKLTDAFFADPEAVGACYVLPVRLTQGSDSILEGTLKEGAVENVLDGSQWDVLPKNYTLWGIKYKNKYHGVWLSRGTVTTNGESVTHEDPQGWWENEELHYLSTKSLTASVYTQTKPVSVTLEDGTLGEDILTCDVIMTVGADGNVTFSCGTEGCTVTGSGKYTYHGAGQAWGALERDLFELDFTYEIPYVKNHKTGETDKVTVNVKEKLVSRDRQSKYETFSYNIGE